MTTATHQEGGQSRPHIDTPAQGGVYSPGVLTVSGVAQPGVTVQIENWTSGEVLASVPVAVDGTWQTPVTLSTEGQVTLVAVTPGPNGERLVSDPVMVILAPPVQPNTGENLAADPGRTGRIFTALLALLLSAGGFSIFFAGRMIYILAKDRLKPR